jgi:hypothetical protein
MARRATSRVGITRPLRPAGPLQLDYSAGVRPHLSQRPPHFLQSQPPQRNRLHVRGQRNPRRCVPQFWQIARATTRAEHCGHARGGNMMSRMRHGSPGKRRQPHASHRDANAQRSGLRTCRERICISMNHSHSFHPPVEGTSVEPWERGPAKRTSRTSRISQALA